jgi:hypothetical protein
VETLSLVQEHELYLRLLQAMRILLLRNYTLEYRDILGLPEEDAFRDNAAILAALPERRRDERVKSARGATR